MSDGGDRLTEDRIEGALTSLIAGMLSLAWWFVKAVVLLVALAGVIGLLSIGLGEFGRIVRQ